MQLFQRLQALFAPAAIHRQASTTHIDTADAEVGVYGQLAKVTPPIPPARRVGGQPLTQAAAADLARSVRMPRTHVQIASPELDDLLARHLSKAVADHAA